MKIEKVTTMKYLFTLFLSTIFLTSFGTIPGKLLLIGGGLDRSQETAWNQVPYKWAVDNSINKRVAIIGYGENDDFYESYFINNCDAIDAKYFQIASKEEADDVVLGDTLKTYGMVFFKGGDQSKYYDYYKGTQTEEAVEFIFNNGGVIAGTSAGCAILSKVAYVALNNSIDPLDALRNYKDTDITLRDDFFDFFPGYVFDTHFGERGRFPRLIAFMENWKYQTGENIIGIGVDDLTTLAIGSDMIGTVYGTGSVNIYKIDDQSYQMDNTDKVLIDSVDVKQLLHGCSYDFNTGVATGLADEAIIEFDDETGNYTILASGFEQLSSNEEMLAEFVSIPGDNVVIISKQGSSKAQDFKTELESLGVNNVEIIAASSSTGEDVSTNQILVNADKILVVDNSYSTFMTFMESTNGKRLGIMLKADGAISAFVGDNSRFIGRYVVEQYEVSGASYGGNLEFDPGLDLLHSTVVMPRSLYDHDTYENKATGVPRAMLAKELKYGVWLNRSSYMKYFPSNGKTYIKGGNTESPIIILKNNGSNYGFSTQTSRGDGTQTPRMASGFDNMSLHFIDHTDSVKLGNEIVMTSLNKPFKKGDEIQVLYFNNEILFSNIPENVFFKIFDSSGRLVFNKKLETNNISVSKNDFNSGFYVGLFSDKHNNIEKKKIIIQ